ncbi:MAG: flavin reductase family protein [Pseudomonadota bacterium]
MAESLKKLPWEEAISLSSPHPYVLVVSADAKNKPNIMGLSWWTICSREPPMLAISVGRERYTRECLDAHGEFVVCLIGEEHARGAWLCGRVSGRKIDKFEDAGFNAVKSLKVSVPTIGESVVAFECRRSGKIETGDHILYVGHVVAMRGSGVARRHLFARRCYEELFAIGPDGTSTGVLDVG